MVQNRLSSRASLVLAFLLIASVALSASALGQERSLRPADILVPDGLRIEVAVEGLAAPTMVAFDDQKRMLIAESGYCPDPDRCPDGPGEAKVTRIERNGRKTVLVRQRDFGDQLPLTSLAINENRIYVAHGGSISVVEGGGLKTVISGLPGQGDHQANQIVFKDGFMYFGVGTVTNSAVVGPDNAVFGWLKKEKVRNLHDIPCKDVTLIGGSFDSLNPFRDDPDVLDPLGSKPRVETGAYAPFGTVNPPGHVVTGNVKCNGAILRARPDGSELQMVAWGLRNPYGLEIGADGAVYATNHGFDARGSRPIENAWDCFYRIEEGAWYGWPDFACERPVTDSQFRQTDKPQPQFLIANHPTESPPRPIAKFNPHAATNGFAFSPSKFWGPQSVAYIALFGDFAPATGTVDRPQGTKIVRVDAAGGGKVTDFIENKTGGRASQQNTGGLEHPSDVTFGPDNAMYIADWGVARVSVDGLQLDPRSGVVWKVSRGQQDDQSAGAFGPSVLLQLGALVGMGSLAAVMGLGRRRTRRAIDGLWAGAVAGLVMGAFTMFVAAPVLRLPWYSPPRVLATMVLGESAVANILEFKPAPFVVGVLVLVVVTVLLGLLFASAIRAAGRLRIIASAVLLALTVWVLLQYFIWPLIFPLVAQRGFPPLWYALSFGVYGLALGALVALLGREP